MYVKCVAGLGIATWCPSHTTSSVRRASVLHQQQLSSAHRLETGEKLNNLIVSKGLPAPLQLELNWVNMKNISQRQSRLGVYKKGSGIHNDTAEKCMKLYKWQCTHMHPHFQCGRVTGYQTSSS